MVIYRYGRKLPIECRREGPGQDPYTVRVGTLDTSTMDTTTTTISTPTTAMGETREPPPMPKQCIGFFPDINQTSSDFPKPEPSLLRPTLGFRPLSTSTVSTKSTSSTKSTEAAYKTLMTSSTSSSITPLSTAGHKTDSSQTVSFLCL